MPAKKNRKASLTPAAPYDPDPSIPGLGKVSNLLTVIIKPYVDGVETLSDYKGVVATACIAWNTSTLPPSSWPHKISDMLTEMGDMPDELRTGLMLVILEMIKRKLELFPTDTRLIVDYDVMKVKGQYQISVHAEPGESPE